MKRLGLVVAALALAACKQTPSEGAQDPAVRTVAFPIDEPPLADGPGRDVFMANCISCHTSRYVSDQPRFSRATWTKEVDKMRTAFGAPIPADQTGKIVDYLVAVNGSE